MEHQRDTGFNPPGSAAPAVPQHRLALADGCAKVNGSQGFPNVNDLSPDKPGFNSFLHSVADAGLDWLLRRVGVDGRGMDGNPYDMCRELLSTRGEASGTALARRLLDTYEAMGREARRDFFRVLRDRYHVDPDTVLDFAREFARERDEASFERLVRAVEPPRQELFRRLNMAPDGTGALVRMRRDLLHELPENPSLKAVESDLHHLLGSWFNRGFLTLRRIDWQTPAAVLEKLIENESVHEMRGWSDLRRRLARDRRCFAFFHGALPDDPLVFVEVALTKGLATDIETIIGSDRTESDPGDADTAIFYSINNCHEGLKRISFGNFLLKQVVLDMAREFPQLDTYATLSPVPGFRGWLTQASESDTDLLSREERELIGVSDHEGWHEDVKLCVELKPVLERLIAHYLLKARRGNDPLDPVARFHLRNGARLEQINWLGDRSAERLRQSAGFLVNYVYDPRSIERNHEDYVKNHRVVASRSVRRLL